MIFAVRQLQEKCLEQYQDLYVLFIDLTKAFDTVSRPGLWSILSKHSCPPKFISMVRSLQDGMVARVIENGDVSDPFPVTNGVKQGCILAPTLFILLFAEMLFAVLDKTSAGINICYRTDGRFFDLRRLKTYTKVHAALVRNFLFADDCAMAAHSEDDLQCLADCFSAATKSFGLTISIKKTEATKIAVYSAVVLPTLLYGCETWTCYRRHLKKLDQFHLRCLCKLLDISWEDRVTNQEVSRRADLLGIEAIIMKAQLRWTDHVMRMEDSRLPKQIFCFELAQGTRRQGARSSDTRTPSKTRCVLAAPYCRLGTPCSGPERLEIGNPQRHPNL
ncbi:hypothetical protein ACOMHN_033406 [Nucella lapillus]